MNKTNHHIYKAEQIDWENWNRSVSANCKLKRTETWTSSFRERKPMSCPLKSRLLYFTDHGRHTQSD